MINLATINHQRKSIRLKDYDYRQNGAYFVTICVHRQECMLAEIKNGEMGLNEYGTIVQSCWDNLPKHYANVVLDAFVVMPNHIHAIIVLENEALTIDNTTNPKIQSPKQHALSEVIRGFKTFSAKDINKIRQMQGAPVWQRNYYERIIRNEREFQATRVYIENNPMQWALDKDNPNL